MLHHLSHSIERRSPLKKIVSEKIRRALKKSHCFQKRMMKQYFDNNSNHFDRLNKDELWLRKRLVINKFNKPKQIESMIDMIDISIRTDCRFQTWIDTGLYVPKFYSMTDNVAPFYPIVLDHSLMELINLYDSKQGDYYREEMGILNAVVRYINRIEERIDETIKAHPESIHLIKTKEYFSRMIDQKTETLEEGMQRILFWSSLFWQSQHRLVGLGRLDKILGKYDLNGEDEVVLISDFYKELHRYYAFKSSTTSLGDTGQIVILGGVEPDGSYFCNNLTYSFIKAIASCHLPDPKVLLRVSSNVPDDLIEMAIDCISTGIGCPLLANDDVIIPALERFGYDVEDAHNYVTSACWEPLVYGNSLEKNNIKIINFAKPLADLIQEKALVSKRSFDELISEYLIRLDEHVDDIIEQLNNVRWEPDPLASLLTIGCYYNGRNISEGGAKYSDYGVLSVGLSNVINSFFNIKRLVYEEKKYSLEELEEAAYSNFEGKEELISELKSEGYYGRDESDVLSLVKIITNRVEKKLSTFTNKLGGKVKFGLSASNYVEIAKDTSATLDGRKSGEALRSHITCSGNGTYTELLNFAGHLDYSGIKANGNVVDFFISPFLIRNSFDKFCLLIRQAIKTGFFEMQMNVVSSDILLRAKINPELYPDLIVRVWGFSAYFRDLPEDYQNVLIERAIQSERAA